MKCISAVSFIILLAAGLQIEPLAPIPLPPVARPEWRLNLYPEGHAFAFAIVHDADSAYSRRLAPLFDEFDALRMKLTVTLFVFWPDWADGGQLRAQRPIDPDSPEAFFGTRGSPLVDDVERKFYLDLAARGHEIGMHTPSDSSDTTTQLSAAFEYFTAVFGHPPSVYVEHSSRSNKETQENQGAKPQSPYYSRDILNRYAPWVWVDGKLGLPLPGDPRYFDLIAFRGAPFSDEAARRYGIAKVFARTGRWAESNGEGFLRWYSKANVDTLERDRGIALVYTHLNEKWLDPVTRRMRFSLRQSLRYIASRNAWLVPAGTILDRVALMRHVSLSKQGSLVHLENRNPVSVPSVGIIAPEGSSLCRAHNVFHRRPGGDIPVGDLPSGAALDFEICH